MRFILLLLLFVFPLIGFGQTLEEQFAQLTVKIQAASSNEERVAVLIESENLIYRNIPKISAEIGAIEQVQEFLFDPELSYKEIYKSWKKDFEDKKLRELLEDVADGRELKSKSVDALKKSRKYANALRSAHTLLADTEKMPKSFGKYVRSFGHMNDLIAINSTEAKDVARELLKHMDEDNLTKKMKHIEGITTQKFRNTVNSISDDIRDLISREVIDIHQYHAIRKDFKNYIFILKNLFEANGKESHFVNLTTSLDKLNDTFGQLNDFYTGVENAEIMKLKHHALNFDQEAKKALISILDKSGQVACSIQFKKLQPE